jgi:hypothetical protein
MSFSEKFGQLGKWRCGFSEISNMFKSVSCMDYYKKKAFKYSAWKGYVTLRKVKWANKYYIQCSKETSTLEVSR